LKKRKVLFRITLLMFLIIAPLYLFKSIYSQWKIIVSKKSHNREILTDKLQKNFLIRKENFFTDKNYKIALEKLKKEKFEAKGVVIID
jgi:anionic cell wall polymer biosynthesis LytR-Cps2A-Psr (LCP) family protein